MTDNTFHALLLLALVAGATTIATDAYAQSNTAKLDSILEIVEEIRDGQGGDSDSSQITSSITGFQDTLDSLLEIAESNQQSLNDMSELVSALRTDIRDLSAALNSTGPVDITDDVNFLSTTINRHDVAMSDRLDAIDSAMVALEAKMDETQAGLEGELDAALDRFETRLNSTLDELTAKISGLSTTGTTTPQARSADLVRDSVTQPINGYTYKTHAQERTIDGNIVYDLGMDFTCDGPIYLESARTTVTTTTLVIPTNNPNANTDRNYLTADGQYLYDSRFRASADQYLVYTQGSEFGLDRLDAGQALRFESRQYELVANQIAGTTRSSPLPLYDIIVRYIADSDTECSFDVADRSTGATLSESGTLFVELDLPSQGTLRSFDETVSCGSEPVDITGLIVSVRGDGWPDLIRFADLNLTFLDGRNDNTVDVTMGFTADGILIEPTYPIHFDNGDLRLSGTLPYAERAYVDILYKTVSGGSCTHQ